MLLGAIGLLGLALEDSRDGLLDWTSRGVQYLGGIYLVIAAFAAMNESGAETLSLAASRPSARTRYASAVLFVAASVAVRLLLLPSLQMRAVPVTFYPAVILAALYGGRGPALLATILSLLAMNVFSTEPVGQLSMAGFSDWLVLGIFSASSALIIWTTGAMQGAQARSRSAESDVRLAVERERAQQVRHEGERRVSNILNSVTSGYQIIDRDGRFIEFNLAAQQMFAAQGVNAGALVGKHIFDEAFPAARERPSGQAIRRALAERVPTEAESYYGPWQRWFAVHNYPTPEGGVATFFEDITERKRAEEDLRHSEERYRSLVSILTDVPWRTNGDGEFVQPNPGWEQFTGQTPEQTRSAGWSNALHPDDRPHIMEIWKRACETRSSYESRGRIWHAPSQSYHHYIGRATPLLHADGSVREWVGALTDIHEQKAAEQELLRFVGMVDAGFDAIVVRDAQDRVTSWNRGAAELYGWTRDEAIGQVTHSLLKTEFAKPLDEILGDLLRNDRWEGELTHTSKAGARFIVSSRWTLERDAHGQRASILETNRDISERKRAEQAVREHQVLLEAALEHSGTVARAKDRFLASLSHELRTPLTPVLMTASMLLESDALSPAVRQGLDMIRRNVEIEARMVNDLLDLSRIINDKLEINLQHCDIHEVIRRALEVCLDGGNPKKLVVATRLDARGRDVCADSTRLQQVFWNIIQNAFKFTPEGGRISIHSRDVNREVHVEISDTGCGIEPPLLARIFDPLQQGDSGHKESLRGLGLGLAIARRIMSAHGGTLTAASDGKDRGATFTVALRTVRSTTAVS
ncbi:MAG TPA: PAS domain S-box protein [Steroidobacteraceae bacterium]|nr:PAS domain S-box protein [Steroidobacteraceae bacterium]